MGGPPRATHPQYIVPFVINQSGSVLFTVLLNAFDVSRVAPMANALTFVFTFFTAWVLGETSVTRCLPSVP